MSSKGIEVSFCPGRSERQLLWLGLMEKKLAGSCATQRPAVEAIPSAASDVRCDGIDIQHGCLGLSIQP